MVPRADSVLSTDWGWKGPRHTLPPSCSGTGCSWVWSEKLKTTQQPTACSHFVMAVMDVFVFEDGRTVFVGRVTSGPNYIPASECELLLAGAPVGRFRIEGEMIPLAKAKKDLRSISTTEKVDVRLIQRSRGQCKLRSV